MNNNINNTNTEKNRAEYGACGSQPTISSAFSDNSSRRLMNSAGQQIPQPYQTLPGQPVPPQYVQPTQYQQGGGQYVPPQYPQPMQYQQVGGQYVPPQYPQPTQYQQGGGQYVPPQYPQPMQYQQVGGQYVPPQYSQYPQYQPPVNYFYQVIPQEQINKQLYKTHCSRVGLTAMADVGIMFGTVILGFIGVFIFYILKDMGYFPGIDNISGAINIVVFATALSSLFGNMIPAAAHGHKWKIKFTDPFKGDKLSIGFIAVATVTALGLNFIWGYLYNICIVLLNNFIGIQPTVSTEYAYQSVSPVAMIIIIIQTCLIAPVTEEYMFRGILMRTLSKYGATFGIVASAFMFGLMHGNMAQTPMAFLLGLVMGYVATKSGNIRQSIAIHMINNIFVTIPEAIAYFCPQVRDNPDNISLMFKIYNIIEIIAMIFAVIALIYLAITHSGGKKARSNRIQTGSSVVSSAEKRLMKIEIPPEKLSPELQLVKHKFRHFIASGGMIFFLCYTIFSITLESLPYLIAILRRVLMLILS